MTNTTIDTARKLIDGNIRFQDFKEVTFPVKVELAILYFKLNIETLRTIRHDRYDAIWTNLVENNYTLNEDTINVANQVVPFQDLINIIKLTEAKKVSLREYNLLDVKVDEDDVKIYEMPTRPRPKVAIPEVNFSHSEQRRIITYKGEISEYTKDYVRDTRISFRDETTTEILSILNLDSPKEIDSSLLETVLNVYPILYLNTYGEIDLSKIDLPFYQIGLTKTIYDDQGMKDLEYRLKKLIESHGALYSAYKTSTTTKRQRELLQKVRQVEKSYYQTLLAIIKLRYSSRIYTPNFLKNLEESIRFRGVEVYQDSELDLGPRIVIFNIKNEETTFLAQARLNTLRHMINNDQLLSMLEEQMKLTKKEDA